MSKITLDNLSDNLKEYLNGLGLTEAQVQELIDKFEYEKIGDISQLSTEEKGSLVEAINDNKTSIQLALEKSEQAFQRGDEVKTQLVDKLISEGLEVSTNNTFEELISGISLGKRWASGTAKINNSKSFTYYGGTNIHSAYVSINGINFKPSIIIVDHYYNSLYYTSIYMAKKHPFDSYDGCVRTVVNTIAGSSETCRNFLINSIVYNNDGVYNIPTRSDNVGGTATWIAFE